jgi:mRNA-degrading endonuclease RelE of RelBE toxin-antitoxin system
MAKHQIVLKPSAVRDLDRLRKDDAAMIADGMERFLSGTPTRQGKSRIRRLRGIENPDYRLRLGEYRVFYNVDTSGRRVEVLRILHKDETPEYYEEVRK